MSPYNCASDTVLCASLYPELNNSIANNLILGENLFLFDGVLMNSGEDIDLRDGECGNYCYNYVVYIELL